MNDPKNQHGADICARPARDLAAHQSASARRGRRLSWCVLGLLLACASLLAPSAASAQDSGATGSLVIEHFEPLGDQETNVLNIASSDVIPHLGWTTGVLAHYAHEPLRIKSLDDPSQDAVLVSSQTKIELWAGIGFFDVIDLQLILPLVLSDSASSGVVDQEGGLFTIGDLRIVPRATLLNRKHAGGFGLGLEVPVHAPIGDTNNYSGGNLRVEPRLILDYKLDMGVLFSLNAGYLFREREELLNIVTDDAIRLGLGLRTPLGSDLIDLVGTVYGNIPLEDNFDPEDPTKKIFDQRSAPVEFTTALRFSTPWGLNATIGGGAGITTGIGAPSFRVLASIGYMPMEWDEDGDGLVETDRCPTDPEDFDDFQDDDGCPELDNDDDKIVDTEDNCPLDPEDMDGFEDENGCPDLDNDGDQIVDTADGCPDDPEDMDGFEDEDGCPDLDNDLDGLPDIADSCPNDPEDMDGFQDEDGCPDYDDDNDGFCDPFVAEKNLQVVSCQGIDKCPREAEIVNGVDDDDGCPDEGKPAVVITETKIELKEQIFFDSGKATIKPVSFSTLDQVVTLLNNHPQITGILIEGHTDDAGSDRSNLKLSKERAASVRAYLIDKGIASERLQSEGYGEDQPLVPFKGLRGRKLKAARSQNRRVEIIVTEVNGKPVDPDGEIKIREEKPNPELNNP